MNNTDRSRKETALSKFLQGNQQPVRSLQPPMIIDVEQFSLEELEAIRQYQEAYYAGEGYMSQQAHVELFLSNRELRMTSRTIIYKP